MSDLIAAMEIYKGKNFVSPSQICGRHGGLMVSELDSRLSGLESTITPGWSRNTPRGDALWCGKQR